MYTMDHFEPITLGFDGQEYTIPEDSIWGLLKRIEPIMGFSYLVTKLARNDIPTMSVYEAYASALNYAGANKISPMDVAKGASQEDVVRMAYELVAILRMMNPPDDMDILDQASESSGSDSEADDGKKKQA